MNAVLSVEIELTSPVLVDSAALLGDLHPSHVRGISVRLTSGEEQVAFDAPSKDGRLDLRSLVALAQKSQPEGTAVLVWYQGRSESLVI